MKKMKKDEKSVGIGRLCSKNASLDELLSKLARDPLEGKEAICARRKDRCMASPALIPDLGEGITSAEIGRRLQLCTRCFAHNVEIFDFCKRNTWTNHTHFATHYDYNCVAILLSSDHRD